jgi:hypothetical protein
MRVINYATGVMEMESAMGSIYSQDSVVYTSGIILSFNESHTLSFPFFDLTSCFGDIDDPCNCMDPHHQVVSYVLTLFLYSSCQNHLFS